MAMRLPCTLSNVGTMSVEHVNDYLLKSNLDYGALDFIFWVIFDILK